MILKGMDFGRAWCSSGARNFFGQDWRHHRRLGPLAPDFTGTTLVAKTTTVGPRAGNLPLDGDLMPRERRPKCIKVNFRRAAVLNAVGLSGPGLAALLDAGRWQGHPGPLVLSFAATSATATDRVLEARRFAAALRACNFRGVSTRSRLADVPTFPLAVEVNLSCPNAAVRYGNLVDEALGTLADLAYDLPGVPFVVKLNALVPPETACVIADSVYCAAISVSNTIPWGQLPDRIDWYGLFGAISPLAAVGGGGLSGAPLTAIVRDWVRDYVERGGPKPIVAGGGVMTPADATALLDPGAAAVQVGSVAIVRPWRVGKIVDAIKRWTPKR